MRSFSIATASIFLLGYAHQANAQLFSKKYVRKNKNAPISVYGDSGIYARGLFVDSTYLYLGNSDGSVYRYDVYKETPYLLFKLPHLKETRDLEYANGTLYAMHSGDDGILTKITKKGATGFISPPEWKGVFFDALDFRGNVGFLMGDPVDGTFSLFHSKDGGKTWLPCEGSVPATIGEAGFAASGSNVHIANDSTYMFISGGMSSNFYKSNNSGKTWSKVELPYYPSETIGPYSLCFSDDKNGVIVGGNYKQPSLKMNTAYYTHDGGITWYNSMTPPGGYRSCAFFASGVYYCCGQNGIDYSYEGKDWFPFAEGAFYALTVVNNQLIATMRHGRFQSFDLVTP